MWVGYTAANEQIFVVPEQFGPIEKRHAIEMVRRIFKAKGVVQFAFITEAWTLDTKNTPQRELERVARADESIEHHADRTEVIVVQVEDRKRCLMAMIRILRPEHGKPKLAPMEVHDEALSMKGRMTHLLA